uniref:DUF4338 domain-containing protein n=1 Tax=Caenorhabditis tropicalis TaxID=1561998 RepID=A0A1I7TT62_9PELO
MYNIRIFILWLIEYFSDHLEGWQSRSPDLNNARLISERNIAFLHRSGTMRGTLQLVRTHPMDALFFRDGSWQTVADYFFVKYGKTVQNRSWLVYIKEYPSRGVFPLELVEVF